jgi:DNA replication and repair protein RecF
MERIAIHLEQIQLFNFKNYEALKLQFRGNVVCFTGDNGSGKTNVLDAIYYLSTTKSFISSIDIHAIHRHMDQASITGEYQRDGRPEQIVLALRKASKKTIKRNFKEYDKLADHIGFIPIVVISPYDIVLIWEGSEERRKFLDVCISQQDPRYLQHLLSYNHALTQRNNLLKLFGQRGGYQSELLEPWDFQLMEHGQAIYEKRKQFIDEFNAVFESVYRAIAGPHELPGLEYESELLESDFSTLLRSNKEKDQTLERTSGGIHRDDLMFSINALPIKKMASQGQQKSFLIAVKLTQYKLMNKVNAVAPILLLDDLFDKIDESRARCILNWVQHNVQGQVFMTDTHPERIPQILNSLDWSHQHVHIRNGAIADEV